MTLLTTLIILFFVAMLAGFVDTLAGGGGMLTVPALLMTGATPAQALATNKLQGTVGATSATLYFLRRGDMKWQEIKHGVISSCIGSIIGAAAILVLPKEFLEYLIPPLLVLIGIVLLCMPSIGQIETLAKMKSLPFALGLAAPIGFYDGFFGPGTGTFFMLAIVTLRGLTIQQATIRAKAYNSASNFTAMLIFLFSGKIVWSYGITMACGQLIGARIASKMIISKGNRFIRPVVIIMSFIMAAVLAYKYWV